MCTRSGWRVGGKCATGRNPDACERIQEHGIHIFANFYFNAMRMVKAVFEEIEWDEHDKHRTMEEAFLPSAVVYNTDYFDEQWHGFLSRFPFSDGHPWEGPPSADTRKLMQNVLSLIDHHLAVALERREQSTGPVGTSTALDRRSRRRRTQQARREDRRASDRGAEGSSGPGPRPP